MIRFVIAVMLLLAMAESVAAAAARDAGTRFLPATVVRLPPTVPDVIIADTSSATLHHFTNVGGQLQWQKAYYMSIGQNGVRKERARDRKTPLGIYFVNEQIDTAALHGKYGVAAYALDYPNAWDRLGHRSGYGIWLHGVDRRNPRRPPLDTDGCLALPNAAMLELAATLGVPGIPVLVADKLRWAAASDIQLTEASLSAAVEKWRTSILTGDLAGYLALYGDDFRHHGLGKADWAAYRMQVFDSRKVEALEVDKLVLLADPADDGLYLARFTQTLTVGGHSVTITKRLYWRRLPNDRWKIVAEGAG